MATAEVQYGAAADLAQKLRKELLAILRSVDGKVERVAELIDGLSVPHRWVGTRLDILGPDGWIEGPDLQGVTGADGLPVPLTFRITSDGDLEVRPTDAGSEVPWTYLADADRIAGVIPFDGWDAELVPYPARAFLRYDDKLWLANVETSNPPTEGVEWTLMVDPVAAAQNIDDGFF